MHDRALDKCMYVRSVLILSPLLLLLHPRAILDASKEDESIGREQRRSTGAGAGADASRLLHLRPCHSHGHRSPGTCTLSRVHSSSARAHVRARPRKKKKVLSLCLLVKLASFTRSKSQTLRCKRIITAQGDAPLAEPPAKKEVREIEFFPAASAHHRAGGGGGGRVSVPDEPAELAASFSSPYGAASHTAPQLDLSLRL
jgi:hypothetical protein